MKHIYNQLLVSFFMLVALCAQAQTFQQANQIGGPSGTDEVHDVATDASDNFYTVGTYTNKITVPAGFTTTSTLVKTFIIKYNSSGTVVWSKEIYSTGSNFVKGYKIAVDNSGEVFISGSLCGSSVYFDGFSGSSSLNGPSTLAPDGFVAKYSSTGTFMWVRAIGSSGNNDEMLDMTLDTNGDVYVAGYIAADASVYGRNNAATQAITATIASQGGTTGLLDVLVAKFANDGTYQWGFTVGSTAGAEKGTAIATDASNNVYVGGIFFNTVDFDPAASSGTATLTESSPQGSGDAFVAKYATDGTYSNVGQISGASVETINRMHVGASGALNVAGSFSGFIDADLRSGNVLNLTAAGSGKDILLAKYNLSTFAPVFAQKMGGNNVDDEAIGVKSNSSGDVYATGYFSGSSVNFNPGGTALNLTSVGGKDVFITKYNSTGVNTWGFSAGSTTDDQGTAMDFNSFVYAGGFYTGAISDFNPGSGTSSLTNLGTEDSYWCKYQECTSTPTIVTQPTGQTSCAGAAVNLSITVSGSGITYQWQKGGVNLVDGGNVSGSTTSSLSITSSTSANAGTYTCIVSSCGNNATSNNAVVVVNTPPSITTQPTAASVCAGGTASFSVVATGTTLTYQWQLNGTPISNNAIYAGAQAATLNLVSPTSAQAGNYTCVITGSCTPTVTTTAAALTVGSAVTITSNPTAVAVCSGNTATFTVAATGSSLTYQWQKGAVNLSNSGNISGALTSTLQITGATASDASSYKCIITGSCGSATSTAAALSITTAPSITTQPNPSQSICAGQNASFVVVASGAVSYQWMKNGTNLTNTGNVTGALSATLVLAGVSSSDVATYTCQVTGACTPAAVSNNAALSVNTLPAITTQPTASTICSGASAIFTISATGTGITYQWQLNGSNVVNSGNIFGATTNSLTITGTTSANAGNYTCIVSGTCTPSVTSSSVALTVNSTASISSNPTAVTTCVGQTATFTLGTTGSGITYQWKKGGVNVFNGGTISGALTSVLTITGVVLTDAGNYTCEINNTCSGILTSTAAALTVNSLPSITTQPTDVTICGSSAVSFSVSATGTSLTYQWKKGGTALVNGGTISGATSSTLSITPAVAADAGAYTCLVSGTCSPSATSSVANLAVGSVASITTQPANTTVCSGTTASLSITVSGTGISYQWQKNGVNLVNSAHISGATSASLSIANVTSSDADNYTCNAGNTCSGFLTSSVASVTVNDLPAITTQPTSHSLCSGTATAFSITATGTGITYQWKKDGATLVDGSNISGALTSILSLSTTTSADAGTYTCEVSGTCSPKAISTGATLTIFATGSIITQPTSQSVCSGSSAVFVCGATGGSISYQWKKGGTALVDGGNISGSATSTLTISGVSASDVATYVCEATSTCSGTMVSNSANLTVNTSTTISSQPNSSTNCVGDAINFDVTASGSSLVYQWTKNGTNITGATNSTYSIASAATSDAGSYVCNITSACSSVSSNSATLVVNAPISIVTQPADVSACPNDNVILTITTTGTVSSYQWSKNGTPLVDGGNISNSATAMLTIASVSATDVAAYSCTMVAACGTNMTSTSANLTLSTAPVITTQPSDKLVCIGQPLTLTIVVSNPGSAVYQWQKNGFNLADGSNISGSATATLTISSATAADAGGYTCNVSTLCSSTTTSNSATVSTTSSASITTQPITATICKGQPVLYKVVIAGSGIVYQWQYKSNTSTVYSNVADIANKYSGSSTNSLTIINSDVSDEGSYRCLITEVCGATQNSAAAGLILDSPNIIQNPFPQSVCLGQPVKFTIAATGGDLTYQWYKDNIVIVDGGNVSGSQTVSLMLSSTSTADNGDYTCMVTSSSCSPPVTSLSGTLTVSVCTAISLADLNDQKTLVYPIPANENLNIEIKDKTGTQIHMTLFDARGSLILNNDHTLQTDNEKITLNTTELPQGMYYMQIQFGNEFYTDKIEVIH
jgi:hypothetical protein